MCIAGFASVNFVHWIDEKSVNLFFPPKLNYISVSLAVMANLGLVCIAELMPASNKLSNTVKLTYSRPPKLFDVTDLNWWKTLYVSLHWRSQLLFPTRILIRINEEFIKNSVKLINQMTFEFLKYFDQKCDCKSRWPFIKKRDANRLQVLEKHCTFLFQ